MKTKKVILRRMTALYVVFFVVIALGIVRSFAESGDTVHVGFNDGWNNTMTAPDSDNVGFIYELRTTRGTAYDIPVCGGGTDSVTVCARPALLDIRVEMPDGEQTTGMSSNTYAGLYIVLAALLYGSIFVILFIVIGSLRRSIRRDDVFQKSNIALTRTIGILLIAASLLFSLASWLEAKAAAPYFANGPYVIDTSFPFNMGEIMLGVLIFIIAEIFSISSMLSEEQKLTI